MLRIGGPGSGKTNSLLNLINHQTNTDKICLYAKDLYEEKCQFLINKQESTGFKHFNDPKAFIEYSNDMNDIYKNIEEYNPDKKRKILIVYDDMIADMLSNKNDYTTGCLLDYPYFIKTYIMIPVDLSKQKALDFDPKVIQQINFTVNLDIAGNTRVYSIL